MPKNHATLRAIALAPEPEQVAPESGPLPLTKADLLQFAAEHGYSKARVGRVWHTLFHTANCAKAYDGVPMVRFLVPGDDATRVLDLGTIYERLVASNCRCGVWWRASRADLDFLIHFVNEHVPLVEPLWFTEPEVAAADS